MEATQLTFGWDIEAHRARDARLKRVFLPRSVLCDDATVAEDKVRFLLDRLNHHAWGDQECYPAQETLAAEMGVDTKTIRRTIQALVGLGLVEVARKKAARLVCNHYRIRWDKIDERGGRGKPHPESVEATGQYARLVDGTDRTFESTNRTLLPDQPVSMPGPTGQYAPQLSLDSYRSKEPPPPARALGRGRSRMIWGRKVDESELFDDDRIEVLFGQVVKCGIATDDDDGHERQRFAALVVNIRRQKCKPKERVGLLTTILEGRVENLFVEPGADPRDWRHRPNESDRDEARQILKRLEGIGPATFVDPHVEEAVEIADLEAKREHEMAALAEWARGKQ
jgi:hypothetical protein